MSLSLVVIEDDEDLRALLAQLLSAFGAEVQAFDSVAEAQQSPGWDAIDAAVVDWMMPEVSGVDMVRWLVANHPDVRRILLTAAPEVLLRTHPDASDVALVLSKHDLPQGLFAALGMS